MKSILNKVIVKIKAAFRWPIISSFDLIYLYQKIRFQYVHKIINSIYLISFYHGCRKCLANFVNTFHFSAKLKSLKIKRTDPFGKCRSPYCSICSNNIAKNTQQQTTGGKGWLKD